MLSRADDYLVHQTAEPVAAVATGDRNFYDRYFFNGYTRDGEVYFALALGVYPNRQVMDASVNVLTGGRQFILRTSRRAPADRVETTVGPIAVQVVEPLRKLRLVVAPNEHEVEMDLVFDLRGPAIEEPRFTRRAAQRLIMDYTRLTQHGCWQGRLRAGGREVNLDPERTWGSRDRSWGIRPLGEPEGGAPSPLGQFFWLWAPFNFPRHVTHFDVNEESSGERWHEMGLVAPAGQSASAADAVLARRVEHRLALRPGTRHARAAEIELALADGRTALLRLRTLHDFFMSGLGYLHPVWGHGTWHGEEASAAETLVSAEADRGAPLYLHVQAVCEAKLEGLGGRPETGIGVLEQLILGPHAPLGLRGLIDGAPGRES